MEKHDEAAIKTKQERIEWMDVYKGILIFLVVIGHATGKYNSWIYQFHMAGFFFASGFLSNLEKKSDLSVIMKKVLTILLPFITLGIAGAGVNAFINHAGYYEFLFGTSYLGFKTTLIRMFFYNEGYVQYWGTFWFLIVLFNVELFHIMIFQLNGKKINFVYLLFCLVLFGLGYLFVQYEIKFRWLFDLVCIAQFYYATGLILKKINIKDYLCTEKKLGGIIVFCVAILVAIWGKMNGITVDFPSRKFNYIFGEYIVAISSVYIIYFISRILSEHTKITKNIITMFGRNSLGIMVLHFIFFKIFMVWLYITKRADAIQIINVILPNDLSDIYWFPMFLFSIAGSLVVWLILKKIPVIRFLLGQDSKLNNIISNKICTINFINKIGKNLSDSIKWFWDMVYSFIKEHREMSFLFGVLIVLFAIPMARTGVIINDELQARYLAMQGFIQFYKTEFRGWMSQGRLLAAPINSFTKYLGFIGSRLGTFFRLGSVLIILGDIVAFGIFIYKIMNRKYFAVFVSVLTLGMMPIAFEHSSPNAFVGFIAFPFMLVLISLTFYTNYIDVGRKRDAVVGMILFFVSMMSYEAFITYTVLFMMIVLGKTGIKNIKEKLKLYLIPVLTAFLFLICYIISGKIVTSGYDGNQIGVNDFMEPLRIISNLFVVSIPGFYVFFPRYQNFKNIYYNLETVDYVRIILFVVSFGMFLAILFRKIYSEVNDKLINDGEDLKNNLYIVLCGLAYMILPSVPNSVSAMYQGIVGFHGSFLALPITYMEYFSAVFLLSYIIWHIMKRMRKEYISIIVCLICVLIFNIQQMNDIFSKEQNSNFSRLETIEAFLQTNAMRSVSDCKFYAADLYRWKNLLAIHDDYWTLYSNNVLHLPLQLVNEHQDDEIGNIFYDGDNFVIVTNAFVTVLSSDRENYSKAVQITDDSYVAFDFQNEEIDGKFYSYTVKNDGKLFSKKGYIPNYGYFADGWIEKESSYTVTTGESGIIHGKLYYPGNQMEDKTVTIYINQIQKNVISISDSYVEFDYFAEPNEIVDLILECNFEYEDKGSDVRDIAIILSELYVE